MSIKNPISGQIKVDHVDEIIMDDPKIDQSKIKIIQNDQGQCGEKASAVEVVQFLNDLNYKRWYH